MKLARCVAIAGLVVAVGGCQSLTSWIPTIPPPNFDWLTGGPHKPGPLPTLDAKVTANVNWQVPVGKAGLGFSPVAVADALYASASDGTLLRVDPATGRTVWRVSAAPAIATGVGANTSIAVVGTGQGQVQAINADGSKAWTAQLSSEVTAPAAVAEGVAILYTGDGRTYALDAGTGKTKWIFQRQAPALVVRNAATALISHGGVFVGAAGGKLSALDANTGVVAWEATVATPKGATELERIADITSTPVLADRVVCSTAFQGRTVCLDAVRGTSIWSRDIPSYAGMVVDAKNVYLTDDSGNVQALDRATGASVWKQDLFTKRYIGGPQLIGDYVGVVDSQGYLHILAKDNGAYVGRLATDGSGATAQPISLGGSMAWQSRNGTLYSVGIR
ncbi:MAG: outer membrane protein assembly factor BamB [Proteobacteria bacterium]|nr:outer membrane protein assembly factor BamB [Pseudomonadota bacterium]